MAGCVFAEDEAELLISAATTPAELSATMQRAALSALSQRVAPLSKATHSALRCVPSAELLD